MIYFPVYFDNAASTFPKPENVLRAVNRNLRSNTSNPGRSGHSLSFEAAERIFEAREVVAEYFGCEPENVVFTKNATESINLLLFGLLSHGDHVIVSDMEHNSVTRPLTALSTRGVTFDIADSDNIEASVNALIRPETKLIFPTAVSNVTGKVLPLRPLAQIAHKNDILFGTDASQAAGHIPIDMKNAEIDYLCTSGHKGLFGIQGSGLLLFRKTPPSPLLYGGTGTESLNLLQPEIVPEALESGTVATPAIISLCEGIRFLRRNPNNSFYEKSLVRHAINELKKLKNITLYSSADSVGTVAFNVQGSHSEEVTSYLSSKGICVRGGFHCSALAHKKLGTTESGVVRVSFSPFNTVEEVDYMIKCLKIYKKLPLGT